MLCWNVFQRTHEREKMTIVPKKGENPDFDNLAYLHLNSPIFDHLDIY
jgi:hypothetical protein